VKKTCDKKFSFLFECVFWAKKNQKKEEKENREFLNATSSMRTVCQVVLNGKQTK
jgi:hypothetical protein